LSLTAVGVGALDEEDVSLQAPAGAPRVLDLPVVLARHSAVTNSEDTVVKVGSTCGIHDTTRVELE